MMLYYCQIASSKVIRLGANYLFNRNILRKSSASTPEYLLQAYRFKVELPKMEMCELYERQIYLPELDQDSMPQHTSLLFWS